MATRKPVNLWVKLGITMTSVIVIALLVASTLNFLRLEETYERLVAQRLNVTAEQISRVVVTGLDLGLSVRTQGHLSSFVDSYMEQHPEITISVFDCSGEAVIGKATNADGQPWTRHAGQPHWRTFSDDTIGVGMTVENNLGKCAAGLAVETSARASLAEMSAISTRFVLTGVLAAAAACLVILGALFLFSRQSALRRLDDDLLHLATANANGGTPSSAPISEDDFSDPWERMLAQHYLAARPNLIQAEAEDAKEDDR